MSYRSRTEKILTLPSGSTVRIEALNALSQPFIDKKVGEESQVYGARLVSYILLNKIGPIDNQLRVVANDKVTDRDKEISVEQVEQRDVDAIYNAVMKLSGFGADEEAARKTFPEEGQKLDSERAPVGAVVSGVKPAGNP